MAHYLVRAKADPTLEAELSEKIKTRSFVDLKPFGRAMTIGLENARIDHAGRWAWEEEDYCTPPLKQEKVAVLDRYFRHLDIEKVREGEGWKQIEELRRVFPRTG